MDFPKLMPGDVFATKNPNGLGKAICLAQKVMSQDGEAVYGHTGIIQDNTGKTIEAVWKIAEQNLFEKYKGDRVMIVRWNQGNPVAIEKGLAYARKFIGRQYPVHRLLLHALGLARWVHLLKTPVCSELTASFLIRAGADLYCGDNCYGVTPDNLVDDWVHSKFFDVLFEGDLKW